MIDNYTNFRVLRVRKMIDKYEFRVFHLFKHFDNYTNKIMIFQNNQTITHARTITLKLQSTNENENNKIVILRHNRLFLQIY